MIMGEHAHTDNYKFPSQVLCDVLCTNTAEHVSIQAALLGGAYPEKYLLLLALTISIQVALLGGAYPEK